MPELGKINFKINVIPNGLEIYMSFNVNNKFIFIDIFQFLSSSLDSLVNSLGENNFNYLNQELDSKLLDLVKQKGFYPHEHLSDFEKFKEKLTTKEKFYISLNSKKVSDKEYAHVLKVWDKFEMKSMKDCHNLYLKRDVLLLADVFGKI